ncbi:hypothetical protein MRX96_030953 [Rhipicephalus microplus]
MHKVGKGENRGRKMRHGERTHPSRGAASEELGVVHQAGASIFGCLHTSRRPRRTENWATDFYLQAPNSLQVPFRRPLSILQRVRFPTVEDVQEPSGKRHRSSGLGRHSDFIPNSVA